MFIDIKNVPEAERPRERLLARGVSSLSAVELVTVILGNGMQGASVGELSANVFSKFGDLSSIGKLSVEEMLSIKGIGLAKACKLVAVFEVARRFSSGSIIKRHELKSTKDVYSFVKPYIISRQKEHFIVVCLDARRRFLGVDNISIGTVNQSLVHPREVFKPAINRNASYVVLVHNHPSGDVNPSLDDINTTERLVDAARMIGIPIIDHVIVSDEGYLSLKDNSRIKF
jgi:DNA repair protein RadC